MVYVLSNIIFKKNNYLQVNNNNVIILHKSRNIFDAFLHYI